MNSALIAVVAVLAAVGLVLGGVNYYYYLGANSQIQQDRNTIAGLQSTISSLQSQVSQATQTQSSQSAQIVALQSNLQGVSAQLASVSQSLNAAASTDAAFQSQLSTELRSINATLQDLVTKFAALTPQVPLSTLVVTSSSYDNSTAVYRFSVHNTQTFAVYAQLSVSFYGNPCNFYAGEGSYMSQVITFSPGSNNTVTMNLKTVAFTPSSFCGKEPISYFSMDFVASSTVVSPNYSFQVLPPYQF